MAGVWVHEHVHKSLTVTPYDVRTRAAPCLDVAGTRGRVPGRARPCGLDADADD